MTIRPLDEQALIGVFEDFDPPYWSCSYSFCKLLTTYLRKSDLNQYVQCTQLKALFSTTVFMHLIMLSILTQIF